MLNHRGEREKEKKSARGQKREQKSKIKGEREGGICGYRREE